MLAGRLRQIGRGAWPLLLGVTDWASIASAARRAATLDILVNNAGISGDGKTAGQGNLGR
jgi:NAD(P)-dependent dehydrogenase (short-subunit alcohol dehydrogenase family)